MMVFMSTSESDRQTSANPADVRGAGTNEAAPDSSAEAGSVMLSVGDAAEQLGLPPSTLRTWERRYGLAPSARTTGNHRRYDDVDVRRLLRMQHLLSRGLSPSEAAKAALRSIDGHIVTGADLAEAVVDAARADDSAALQQLFANCIDLHGTVEAWSDHISVTMQRVSEEWFAGGLGIDAANLVNDALLTTLATRHVGERLPADAQPVVLLAAAGEERHALPLLALQATLADLGIAGSVLGQRTSYSELAARLEGDAPAVVFLWASRTQVDAEGLDEVVAAADAAGAQVLLGGPGWRGDWVTLPVHDGFESAAEAIQAVIAPVAG